MSRKSPLVLLLALIPLAACTLDNMGPQPSPTGANWRTGVDILRKEILLSPDARGGLNAFELERARAVVNALRPDGATHVTVAGPPLAASARAALLGMLERAGVPVGNIEPAPDDASPRLVVVTYVALAPDCQTWADIYAGWYENLPTQAMGCSNIRNLSLMVADPRDLIHGRETDPADGARMAGAIHRYRADQVKKLPAPNDANTFVAPPILGAPATGQ